MKAAVYARVSTDQQAEKGYSLETQIEACKARAGEKGALQIEEFVDDGYSGEYIERPALDELRARAGRGEFQIAVFYDLDRLARKSVTALVVAQELERARVEIVFVRDSFENNAEGRMFFQMRSAIAEFEREKIKERTLRGKKGKARKGLIISNARPLGYRFNARDSMYEIDAGQAELVRHAFLQRRGIKPVKAADLAKIEPILPFSSA